jgi:ABC-type antimicrobial peptide transport system permease subunit
MSDGDAQTTLSQPNHAIVSEGVMKNSPAQTNVPANVLVSYNTLKDFFDLGIDQWGLRSQGSVFVRLPPNTKPAQFEGRMKAFVDKYMKSDASQKTAMYLQELDDIHFDVESGGTNFVPAVSPRSLSTIGAIAIIVLLIACVNFINLSTARATLRAKEVGVRKTIGATRKQLLLQFLGEAGLLTTMSALLSIALAYAVLPVLNNFLSKEIAFSWTDVTLFTIGLVLLTTVIAGLYPALFLTQYTPVKALRGMLIQSKTGGVLLRQGLVVFQYSVSLILAVSVIIIYQQMKLLREKDLGFAREAILTVDVTKEAANQPAFKQSLLQLPGVEAVSFALGAPTAENNFNTSLVPDPATSKHYVDANVKLADHDYIKTYGLQLLAGRFLQPSDTLSNAQSIPFKDRKYVFVINEAAVRAMNLADPAKALGRSIRIGINDIEAEIVGVVRDFHVSSLHDKIKPAVIMNFPFFYLNVGIKLTTRNYSSTVQSIEKVWKEFNKNTLYEPLFLDQTLQNLYVQESQEFTLIQTFSVLALVICSLGLWGLSVFLIERRKKEIGVRKVLGASVVQLTTLLTGSFIRLVVIAIVVASPIAWYAMSEWLQNFSYRVDITIGVFIVSGAFAIIVAIATVSLGATRAALANPVKSLKTD